MIGMIHKKRQVKPHNHIYYHSHELDVVLLGHDVRNFYADIVARYGNLGQMLGRIAVAVRFVDRLEVSLQKRRELTRWYEGMAMQ